MGLWRGKGEAVSDINWVLAGKGILGHWDYSRKMKKFTLSWNSLTLQRCDRKQHLTGLALLMNVGANAHLAHVEQGACSSPDIQINRAREEFWGEDCYF